MDLHATKPAHPHLLKPATRNREDIPREYQWLLTPIFPGWDAWEVAHRDLDARIVDYASRRGTLARGGDVLLATLRAADAMGELLYKVWYYPALWYDQDQRDNTVNARRQQVQILLAKWQQASAWFNPELLQIPLETVRGWMDADPALAVYRFAIEDLYRQQQHVLDEQGERLLSFSGRFDGAPSDAFEALSTADAKFPQITLTTGETVTVSHGEYRSILATRRRQEDRAAAFHAYHEVFANNRNTYAALYDAVCQRDWFHTRARRYDTTLDAALFGNAIPAAVVENLIATTRRGVEPLRRYHRLRRRALKLDHYYSYDTTIPLIEYERQYPYGEMLDWVVASVGPLGADYQARVRSAFKGGWIDVYENEGKRSGAYSAPVYGVHPYMLLNYNDTLDAVFTTAHEMGHSIHTLLSHESQPFVYAGYTIFVAEVPSTLSEGLLLEYMLAHSDDPREKAVLLQHAIDNVAGTFFNQVLFADYELQAHRLVEQDKPITADVLSTTYAALLDEYLGDSIDRDPLAAVTWARVPHFFNSPYYVYQYATCFASAARLLRDMTTGSAAERRKAVGRYIRLLRSGGSNHPMELLKRAGVDLGQPDTVRAVIDQFDVLVTRLEHELRALGAID